MLPSTSQIPSWQGVALSQMHYDHKDEKFKSMTRHLRQRAQDDCAIPGVAVLASCPFSAVE